MDAHLVAHRSRQRGTDIRLCRRGPASSRLTPWEWQTNRRQDLDFLQSCSQIKKEYSKLYAQHTHLHLPLDHLTEYVETLGPSDTLILPVGMIWIRTWHIIGKDVPKPVIEISNLIRVCKRTTTHLSLAFEDNHWPDWEWPPDCLTELISVSNNDIWWQFFNEFVDKIYIKTGGTEYDPKLVVDIFDAKLVKTTQVDRNLRCYAYLAIYLKAGHTVPRRFNKYNRNSDAQYALRVWLREVGIGGIAYCACILVFNHVPLIV